MKKPFSYLERDQFINEASEHLYDLVIIGGGITGAGIARDASSRGMKVFLLEQTDFAQGTSSRSSKLIHGGIRYLENLEFHLVFEALSERRILFEIAPHMIHPLRFVLPMYKGSRVGMGKMSLGMWLYDALALFEAPEMHRRLNSQETLEQLPFLQSKDLRGSFAYYDAYMDDDRLVLETLRSAHEFGARSVNFVKAQAALWEKDQIVGLEAVDQLSGKSFSIRGRHIVSTVGPWTDQVGKMLLPDWKKKLRPSKGIHLTLPRDRLPLKDAVVMASDNEKRIIFGIPRHDMIIIGTTDTDFREDPSLVHSTREDVEYLLRIVAEYFPGARLSEEDVIGSYAGVRPLIHDGSETESGTSREHLILTDPRGVTFVAGGKYTTYRAMAEESVTNLLEAFSLEDQVRFSKNATKKPLNEMATLEVFQQIPNLVEQYSAQYSINKADTRWFLERHGLEALDLLEQYSKRKAGPSSLWSVELEHAIKNSMCMHLLDFYLRRTPLFLAMPDHGWNLIETLSETMGESLGWTKDQKDQEINALQKHLQFEMGWK